MVIKLLLVVILEGKNRRRSLIVFDDMNGTIREGENEVTMCE